MKLPKLAWGRFITKIPWLRLAGKLSWATLIAMLAWDLVIKPLGWDKYINLDGLKMLLDKAKAYIRKLFGIQTDLSRDGAYELTPRGYRRKPAPAVPREEPAERPATRRERRRRIERRAGASEKVEQTIRAEVIDKRPPQVNVNASISITGVLDPQAAASAAVSQLRSQMGRAGAGALHGGTE